MESIFFIITYIAGSFNATGKKMGSIFSKPYHFLVGFLHSCSKSNDVENAQELTGEEYNRRFSKFFPKTSRTGEFVILGDNSMPNYDWSEAQLVSNLSNSHLTFDDTGNNWHHDQALARIYETIDQCSNPLRTDNPFTNGFLDNPRNELIGISYN
ncbi:MAG: hypothetical protein PHU14_16240 [Methylovulum sp.]|nr:hypothetical protein [Methylovulum sp.]